MKRSQPLENTGESYTIYYQSAEMLVSHWLILVDSYKGGGGWGVCEQGMRTMNPCYITLHLFSKCFYPKRRTKVHIKVTLVCILIS
uniref:Uncharacterized protein n=1 Tax=Anguilla anguilla TaxID=7936 RepID=A0A0E9WPS4_ANGAN